MTFPELSSVPTNNWRFISTFVIQWIKYTPSFFILAPVKMWWDYFWSSYRVSYDLTRALIALEDEKDIYCRNALRTKLLKIGEK